MWLAREDEQELVDRAKSGDEPALAALLQRHYRPVFLYMVKLTLDSRAAEDMTQEAMERAIRKIASYDPEKSSFGTWLVAIARNRWLDEVRKAARRKAESFMDLEEGRAPDAFAGFIDRDELLHALKGLSPAVRTPVCLCYLLGYRYEEIAKQMRIPLGTVKSRIFNGLKQLRKEVTK